MESVYKLPYTVLLCPNIKLKKPSWVRQPSAMVMFAAVLTSYFLVTGGKPNICLLLLVLAIVLSDNIGDT